MKNIIKVATVAAALVATTGVAHAGAVVSGFKSVQGPTSDDQAVGPASLGFNANYFGTTYGNVFVSSNGYLTFGSGQSTYNPVGLGASYGGIPIIAAFYADVDVSRGGSIGYGTGTFDGRAAFGATWDQVGVYAGSTDDKRNTFQLLLVDRGDTGVGNFDMVFNYDQIRWETGGTEADGGVNGLGGNSASVGYNAGQGGAAGTYFEFAGSRTNGALLDGGAIALATGSNVGTNGRYMFTVRNGVVAPPPVAGAVPEPATWAMMIAGFGMVGGTMRRRSTKVAFA